MKKFTEEQYRAIVDAWESNNTYRQATTAVIQTINSFSNTFTDFNGDQALALANPATREWAHEQFVEKEKIYTWYLKSDHDFVISTTDGAFFLDADPFGKTHFTEKEIENSPFKPNWFDKEEVE